MGSKVFFPFFFSFSFFGNHFKKMNNFQQLKKVGLCFKAWLNLYVKGINYNRAWCVTKLTFWT